MDFLTEFYNILIDFITKVLTFFGLNTDRVPGQIESTEADAE